MRHTLRSQRLAALFAGGWLMLNFPLMGLWNPETMVAGIPLFPLALFVIWGGTIATVAALAAITAITTVTAVAAITRETVSGIPRRGRFILVIISAATST